MTFEDEKLKLAQCQDALRGLANLTGMFKSGVLEHEYWEKTLDELQADTIEICQTIITCVRAVDNELYEVGESIDRKEIEEHKKALKTA